MIAVREDRILIKTDYLIKGYMPFLNYFFIDEVISVSAEINYLKII